MRAFLAGLLTGAILLLGGGLLLVSSSMQSPPPPPLRPSPKAVGIEPDDLTPAESWLADVRLSSASLISGTSPRLLDVEATGRGIRSSPDGIRAEALTVLGTLSWEELSAQADEGTRVYPAGGGRAGIERVVTVLGRDLRVRATGTVRAEDGLVVIEPETIDLDGPDWLDSAASAAVAQVVTIRQPVTGLPTGLRLMAASVVPGGVRAELTGSDVELLNP